MIFRPSRGRPRGLVIKPVQNQARRSKAQGGARGAADWKPASIESFLEAAHPGDKLFVCKSGNLSLKPDQPPGDPVLATIEKGWAGEIFARDGCPSKNGTFVSERGRWIELRGDQDLEAGKLVSLARDVSFRLPKELSHDEPPSQEMTQLQDCIARLPRGGSMVLGREHRFIRSTLVSRQHCTINRLENGCYRLVDGTSSARGAFVKAPSDEAYSRIYGWTRIEPGSAIAIGGYRELVLGEESVEPVSLAERFAVDNGIKHTIHDGYRLAGGALLRPEIDSSKIAISVIQAMVIAGFVEKGLDLIRAERYAQALAYFGNRQAEELAAAAGFKISGDPRIERLADLSPGNIDDNLALLAEAEWFSSDLKASFQLGALPQRFDSERRIWVESNDARAEAATEEQCMLASHYIRELSLIYADKWIRAFQCGLGRPVSLKSALLWEVCDVDYQSLLEIDSCHFLREHAVPVTHSFLSRAKRSETIELLKGVQESLEARRLASLIEALPSGETRTIGANADITVRTPSGWRNAHFKVRDRHCFVRRLGPKLFELRPFDEAPLYHRDKRGLWHRIGAPTELEAGTRVRMSALYEITLGHPE